MLGLYKLVKRRVTDDVSALLLLDIAVYNSSLFLLTKGSLPYCDYSNITNITCLSVRQHFSFPANLLFSHH